MRPLIASLPGKSSLLKKIFSFIITVALTFGPAGLAARVLGVA
jgi:phage shock protein D